MQVIKKIIIGLAISILSLPANAKDMVEMSGVWHPVDTSQVNLFNGDITITKVKKRTTGFYTLIYDKDKHGLVCFYVPQGDYSVCMPATLNKEKITSNDQIDEILKGALESGSMFMRVQEKGEKLTLSIAPFGSDCTNPDKCVFKKLPIYQKK